LKNRSYYEELGVQPDATAEQIKSAYRRLAKKYHPDLNSGDRLAEDRFKRISEAYRILSDPTQRRAFHEKERVRAKSKAASQKQSSESFFDYFKSAWKTGFGSYTAEQTANVPRRGKDLKITLEIDELELARGIKKRVMIKRDGPCSVCGGTGRKPGSSPVQCKICLGIGEVPTSKQGKTVFVTCTNCKGKGFIVRERCLQCGGKGIARGKIPLTIDVPAGTKADEVMTIKAQGNIGTGGTAAGNLKVMIVSTQNNYFAPRGDDLIYDYAINLKELLTGGEIEVPTPDEKIKLSIQPGLKQGKILKVKGKGLLNSNGLHGDLLVRISYHLPEKITPRASELIDELISLKGWSPKKDRKGFIKKSTNDH